MPTLADTVAKTVPTGAVGAGSFGKEMKFQPCEKLKASAPEAGPVAASKRRSKSRKQARRVARIAKGRNRVLALGGKGIVFICKIKLEPMGLAIQ
jgi:hypothetical protein